MCISVCLHYLYMQCVHMPGACSLEENVKSPGKATTGSYQLPYEWELYLGALEEQQCSLSLSICLFSYHCLMKSKRF